MSKMGPAAVRHRTLSDDDERSIEAFPYQPQYFNPTVPSLRRVEVVGLSLPTLRGKNSATSPIQPQKSSRIPQNRSSTLIKGISYSRRHGDMWSSPELSSPLKSRSVILHTDRYQLKLETQKLRCYALWDQLLHSQDGLTQKDRLELEQAYLDKLRSLKRKREIIPHRETHELVMGGKKVIMCERMDIMGEIAKLKSVVLPARAKDLYVGKGFRLPENHALNKPRGYTMTIIRPLKKGEYDSLTNGDDRSPLTVVRERGPIPHFSPVQVNLRFRRTPRSRKPNSQDQVTTSNELDKVKSKSAGSVSTSVKFNGTKSPLKNANSVPTSFPESGAASPTKSISTTKTLQISPLSVKGVEKLVPDEDLETLRMTFQKLSTSAEGQVDFEVLKSHLPTELTNEELSYCKTVYEVSSAENYFGENEFLSLTCLCQKITSLSGATKEAFHKLDISSVTTSISQYVDLFQSVDRQQTGKISVRSLAEILNSITGIDLKSDIGKFTATIIGQVKDDTVDISKTDFLALIPYFVTQYGKQ